MVTFNSIGKLKTALMSLHKNLAFWQSKKRCCIVSLRLQQQHFKLPFHHRLAKLSLVRVTPLIKYHIKILILSDNFSFEIIWLCGIILVAVIALYMDRTENSSFCCRDHTKLSLWSYSWISITPATSWCDESKLLATRDLRKETFSGIELRTELTKADFFLTMLYRVGYWFFKGSLPSQVSSQNLIRDPLPSLNLPHLRNSGLMCMRPDQKWESPGEYSTWVRDLNRRHFLLSKVCHIPCSFINLKSHLLSKYLFWASRF